MSCRSGYSRPEYRRSRGPPRCGGLPEEPLSYPGFTRLDPGKAGTCKLRRPKASFGTETRVGGEPGTRRPLSGNCGMNPAGLQLAEPPRTVPFRIQRRPVSRET